MWVRLHTLKPGFFANEQLAAGLEMLRTVSTCELGRLMAGVMPAVLAGDGGTSTLALLRVCGEVLKEREFTA